MSPRKCRLYASSPRTWGCFRVRFKEGEESKVFPTHVGVFLINTALMRAGAVFPTHVGVFPASRPVREDPSSLPHARGGVSRRNAWDSKAPSSSPRTWGCFSGDGDRERHADVFPTHVGVFPGHHAGASSGFGLPHARGGVSQFERLLVRRGGSSPRTWGCFCCPVLKKLSVSVFPTHVGVFLRLSGMSP